MKNLKKISLISFLACATLAGGILTANTEVEAPVQEQKFYMVDGAQVRVPDAVEAGQEDRDGLRFIAKMTDAYRVAKGELENMSVGMFFLPADKVDTINEAAVFGENATYYWDGCGYEKGDRLEIVHKETYAFEETKGDDFLTIKCSLWNLLPETLDREIGAVAYLRVNVGTKEEPVYEYHFAETGAGARAVSVAQKALLNTKDEIHTVEGGADRVNAAYVNAYLGAEGKAVSYVENVYKETASGEYTKVDTVTKSALMTAYNTEAVAGKVDNYMPFDYKNNKENRVVLFDGTTEVNTYYNYSANRGQVIWDGDENLHWSSGYKHNYWNLAESEHAGTDWSNKTVQHVENTIYEGKSLLLTDAQSGWDGPLWKDLKFIAPTNTFSMVIETRYDAAPTNGNKQGFNFAFYAHDNGQSSDWLYPETWNYEVYEVFGEDNGLNDDADYRTLEAGRYKMTFTISKSISSIRFIEFYLRGNAQGVNAPWSMNIDNITAEFPAVKHANIPVTYTDGSVSFETPELRGSNVFEGQGKAKAVQYRVAGAEGWTDLTANDGVYTISGLTEPTYELNVINQDDTNAVYVLKDGLLYVDNNKANVAERGTVCNEGYSGAKYKGADNPNFVQHREVYGEGMMFINTPYQMLFNPYTPGVHSAFPAVAVDYAKKIGIWAYSPNGGTWKARYNVAGAVWIGGNRATYAIEDGTIYAGYHYYEFTFVGKDSDVFDFVDTYASNIQGIGVHTTQQGVLFVDCVAYVK